MPFRIDFIFSVYVECTKLVPPNHNINYFGYSLQVLRLIKSHAEETSKPQGLDECFLNNLLQVSNKTAALARTDKRTANVLVKVLIRNCETGLGLHQQ